MTNEAASAGHSRTTLRKKALTLFAALGWLGLIANEVRGIVLAVPVMWALYQSGGTLMAWWLAFCSLAGIALSVIVPLWAWKKARRLALGEH